MSSTEASSGGLPLKFHRPSEASQGRITRVETIYHQRGSGSPIAISSHSSRATGSDEQPYIRELKLRQEWVPLDTGWVKKCALVLIINPPGPRNGTVEVSFNENFPHCYLLPGDSLPLKPTDPKLIALRGSGSCTVYVFPADPADLSYPSGGG